MGPAPETRNRGRSPLPLTSPDDDVVILVDETDQPVGTAEKLDAHRRGVLHRAFSVMIYDDRRRLLLQQRHIGKYHSGGLWTNTCCGHPRPDETAIDAATRRLAEEMGFTTPLNAIGTFRYRAELDQNLVEHEFVHLFAGIYNGPISPAPAECDGFMWVDPASLEAGIAAHPDRYTAWFKKYVAAGWPVTRS